MLVLFATLASMAAPQPSDDARVERQGNSAVLSVHTFRPLDAIAMKLGSELGVAVSAEDHEPARSVLLRLGLRHWHVRCDLDFCGIYKW